MCCGISGPLSHAAYTERSTIVDLLIKIPGPLNPAAYTERSTIFSKGPKVVLKKGPKSQMPPFGNLIKNIPGGMCVWVCVWDVRAGVWDVRAGVCVGCACGCVCVCGGGVFRSIMLPCDRKFWRIYSEP